jgi:hypothetical protein
VAPGRDLAEGALDADPAAAREAGRVAGAAPGAAVIGLEEFLQLEDAAHAVAEVVAAAKAEVGRGQAARAELHGAADAVAALDAAGVGADQAVDLHVVVCRRVRGSAGAAGGQQQARRQAAGGVLFYLVHVESP